MKKLLLWTWELISDGYFLIFCGMTMWGAYIMITPYPTHIPNAAAEEARIVCANFAGVESFSVKRGLARTVEGYERYTITAKCASQHTIVSDITIQH